MISLLIVIQSQLRHIKKQNRLFIDIFLNNVEIFNPKSKSYKFGSAATTADLRNVYYESGTRKSDLHGEILVLKLF